MTREVLEAVAAVTEAERCVQRCQRDLERAKFTREAALARQTRLQEQLARIERSLNAPHTGPGVQMRLMPGTLHTLRDRAEQLRRELNGG